MKIAYTGTIFFNQKFGGISRYFTELVKSLKTNVKIFAPLNKNIYLKDINSDVKKSFYINKIPQYKSLIKCNNFLTNHFIRKYNPNILHETYYSENIIQFKQYKKILTIYDLIHEKFQNDFFKNKINEKKKLLNYIDHFICISEQTKKDFINYYKISPKKVSVVYLGGDHLNLNTQYKNLQPIINKPYILYIGSRNKYKNFKLLHKALYKLKVKDLSLVCFGGEKISKEEIETNNSKVEIKQIYGDDKILLNLFKNAICFINTSCYEGFGIPNIEAMKNDCPVVCSDISVFREICKDSVIYFENNNSDDLADKIDSVIFNNELRKKYIFKGQMLSKIYSWDNCAKNTLSVYERVFKE